MFAGGLVGAFGEAPDELLEDETHVVVGDDRRAEVGEADALDDLVEKIGVVELADELGEIEILEDLAGILGEGGEVGFEIGLDTGLAEGGEIHLRGVEEGEPAGGTKEEFFMGLLGELLPSEFIELGEDLGFALGEHAFEAAQEGEGQNDAAVLALLEITAKEVGESPDVGGEVVGRGRH